ncbi:hypothetical protein PCANC_15682 [Puccinia coronata f. sp. avenae]|uniref:Uncharacterized protein n=1 Tax=Puccinia coronata f. sp. avenae TaxID=200324 RepID=A0A2N5U8H7_9BASI|nr:hypothetical protein PCASD_22788 [Puccinia coronata f. sp. avenae]PLW15501.1 hypothetical protein PCANC_15682 [Puccinia coronata f. sp. avenae]PLW34047.1 hypothetical protein PCASD_14474 [Puccinia coronata f. sp. avenae]
MTLRNASLSLRLRLHGHCFTTKTPETPHKMKASAAFLYLTTLFLVIGNCFCNYVDIEWDGQSERLEKGKFTLLMLTDGTEHTLCLNNPLDKDLSNIEVYADDKRIHFQYPHSDYPKNYIPRGSVAANVYVFKNGKPSKLSARWPVSDFASIGQSGGAPITPGKKSRGRS